jgi:hypothetical protein
MILRYPGSLNSEPWKLLADAGVPERDDFTLMNETHPSNRPQDKRREKERAPSDYSSWAWRLQSHEFEALEHDMFRICTQC